MGEDDGRRMGEEGGGGGGGWRMVDDIKSRRGAEKDVVASPYIPSASLSIMTSAQAEVSTRRGRQDDDRKLMRVEVWRRRRRRRRRRRNGRIGKGG
eukprot:758017-Hanusia_phi.AAC.1